MKNVTTNMKNLFAAFAIIVLAFTATTASATGNEKKATKKENPVEVTYIGKIKEQPVLQFQFNNQAEEELYVVLKDNEGNTLYAETFSGKAFSKKFMFQGDDVSSINVQMVISSKKNTQSHSFSINRSTTLVDEVVVSKL